MTIQPHGCDYCHQTISNRDGDVLNVIPLTRKLNGDKLVAEICTHCIKEIVAYAIEKSDKV